MTAATWPRLERRPLLLRAVAPAAWDALLRTSGLVALAGIVLTAFVPPASDLAALASLTLITNGPYSMFLPVSLEPMLMVFARLHPPLVVAAMATAAQTAIECVNLRLYGAALGFRLFDGLRYSPLVRGVVRWFGRAPFVTVAFCALTPVPFWMARVTAALAQYPIQRHLAATAAGRFPRNLFYAALGAALPFTGGQILAGGLILAAVLCAAAIIRHRSYGPEAA